MTKAETSAENRILVLAPFGKDAAHLCKVLTAEGFECLAVANVSELVSETADGVGMILTTEEVLSTADSAILIQSLKSQPAWSAVPVLAFYSEATFEFALHRRAEDRFHDLSEVTFLQRPVSRTTLLSSVRTALRDRVRQFRIRDLLGQLHSDLDSKEVDLTEQVRARRRSEEAKSAAIDASLAKSQFLANMSHEIRTPLGAILGFLELVKDPDITTEETAEYISIIDRNSRHLMRLIDDILDLSKVEAGRMEIESSEFSLGELLLDFAALMQFRAQEKGILFDLKLATSLPARIVSDQVRLRQVLTNVVGNAIKFTDRGSVQLTCSFERKRLKFKVVDTGRGISPEQRAKLFQPFVQADPSTTRQFGGTGLGLVLVRKICEQMKGSFELVRSQLGAGSTFEATVEVQKPADSPMLGPSSWGSEVPEPSAEARASTLEGMRILLVEDSPDNQALVGILLKKFGVTIDVASNGAEGVEMASEGKHHVVLMDVQMPVMDGHEATRELRSRGYRPPIIALTAHAMNEERERTIASGFSDFLAKPLERDKLVQLLLSYKPA